MAKAVNPGRNAGYRKTLKDTASVLEGEAIYATSVTTLTPIEKMQMAQKGVSKIFLEKLKDVANLDYQSWQRLLQLRGPR